MFIDPLKILIFLLLGVYITANTNDCYTYLIGETPVSYSCGSPGSFSSSSLNIKSPYKQLTVSLSIKPTDFCSMTSDFNFLTISILPVSTNGVRKKVMMLTYLASTKYLAVRSEDLSGIQTARTIPIIDLTATPLSFLNNPANLYVSINMAPGFNSFGGGGLISILSGVNTITTVNYGSDWVFDSTLDIAVCSDFGGINSIGCTVQNLKIKYSAYPSSSLHIYTSQGFFNNCSSTSSFNKAKLIGDYKLDDDPTGNTLTNSQGPLSSITLFPTTSPSWIPELGGGLQFTSTSQYFQLSGFTPSGLDLSITTSIAFSFYLKVDTAPTNPASLLSYYCSQLQKLIFESALAPSMKIQSAVDTTVAQTNSALLLGQWNTVYVVYLYTYGSLGVTAIYINGFQSIGYNYKQNAYVSSSLSSSDIITIGAGFVGKLRRFQIYSPAAYQFDLVPCDPTKCAIDLGFATPPTCLKTVCTTPGYYVSFGTCEQCPPGCSTCTDASTCQSCVIGYYLDGTTCKNCPKHCYSCTDSQTCQACDSGYGFYNHVCGLCPAGTYLNSDGSCKQFSPTVQDTLTKTQLVNSAATQAANLISKGSSISLSAAVSGKIFSQIKYLNISYSGELEVALKTWMPSFVSLGLTPDMPQSVIDKIPERHVPYVFQKYDVPSSFLINFWENLGVIVSTAILWVIFKAFELLLISKKAWLPRKTRVFIQNFLITALYGVYGDLLLYSLIEYRALQFGWNLSLLSFLISVMLLMAMSLTFFLQIQLLIRYQRIKKQGEGASKHLEEFTKINEGSQVLFRDFKDYSLAPQLFPFLLCGRDLAFSLLLATMFDYPLAQTLIITILDCLMIAYLFIKRPFKSSFDAAQQYFFELIALLVNVTVLINAILDTGKYQTFEARKNIGKLIIIANMIFNFVTAIFMLITIVKALLEYYKEQKEKRSKKLRAINTINRLQRLPPHENSHKVQTEQNFIQESFTTDHNLENSSQESSFLNLLPSQGQMVVPRRTRRIRKIGPPARLDNQLNKAQSSNDNNLDHPSQVNQPQNRTHSSRIKPPHYQK